MRQPVIQRYWFISPIKTPCRCPHMSRLWLLICSPRFSAWLINKCPCNFAQLVSHSSYRLNEEKKTYSILMHIRGGTQTPHQVVLITASRPYRGVCQWPPSLCPTAAGLCTSDKRCCHQPPSERIQLPPTSSHYFAHPLSCPPSLLWYITYIHSSAPLPFIIHFLLPSRLVSLHFCSFFIPSCNQIMVTPCWC